MLTEESLAAADGPCWSADNGGRQLVMEVHVLATVCQPRFDASDDFRGPHRTVVSTKITVVHRGIQHRSAVAFHAVYFQSIWPRLVWITSSEGRNHTI
jgi:hypothetical protein